MAIFSILLFLPKGENVRKINDCDDKYILKLGVALEGASVDDGGAGQAPGKGRSLAMRLSPPRASTQTSGLPRGPDAGGLPL